MSKLLKEILLYEDLKDGYSKKELVLLEESLKKRCNNKIKKAKEIFIDTIDLINNF